jgi:hypothetical protein
VDLTDGTSRRFEVPGLNAYAIWADASHVLVAEESAHHGTMVDLHDGSLEPSAYGPSTAFLGDTTLTWGWDRQPMSSVLHWGDGRNISTHADNQGGLFPQPPLVKGALVVGFGGWFPPKYPLIDATTGFEVVDGTSGRVLADLPTTSREVGQSLLLGWRGDRPVIGVSLPLESAGLSVFTWNWRAGQLDPIGHVNGSTSWGSGEIR